MVSKRNKTSNIKTYGKKPKDDNPEEEKTRDGQADSPEEESGNVQKAVDFNELIISAEEMLCDPFLQRPEGVIPKKTLQRFIDRLKAL